MSKQQEVLKELVAVRIKMVLARTGQQYERNFYNTVGRGVSPQEYATILDKLVEEGIVTRTPSERGSIILKLAEQNSQPGV